MIEMKRICLSLLLCSSIAFGQELIKEVNPFVGTQNMGHTYPGATAPFGMVQLSPETQQQPILMDGQYNRKTYEYCAGYQYADSTIYGFSHTHFSGTGHSDLGDFLLMPTSGKLSLKPEEYKSNFSHQTESAQPGYYKVMLADDNILAELTTTERVGLHQYTFKDEGAAHLILDLISNIYHYDGKNIWSSIRVENDTLVTGFRQTSGWARNKTLYFAMSFSQPITNYGYKNEKPKAYNGFWRKFNEEENFPEMAGSDIRCYFDFETGKNPLLVKFALSAVSTEGAVKNMQAEIPHWSFDKTKKETQAKWEKELQKIEIEALNDSDRKTFYTALYHTMLGPVVYEDVDGNYKGLDFNTHQSKGFTNHTIFSLWDTYRALHPLFNVIQVERNTNMIQSMLAHYEQSVHGMLPIWSHYNNENWCMIGYHAVSVLADAMAKGNNNFSLSKALEASISTANVDYFDGLGSYKSLGYVAEDTEGASVSKTLEYAYNDWCIEQMATKLNKPATASEYRLRSKSYQKVYDKKTGFMRPKLSNGNWKTDFDELDTHGQGFIEGNAWNYGLYVPHEIPNMISLMGGKERFSEHLDSLFTMRLDDKYFAHTEDITRDGIIGNYVHGNEPGHHIPYLYNWTNDAWKTQERVRMIMDQMYGSGVDGLCGNDDAGQMSAWYIFSSLGFYPVCPGSDKYALGSPAVKSAKINLENGNTFEVIAHNQSKENIYVEKMLLNGRKLSTHTLQHHQITQGGKLEFFLSNKPKQ
jgi:predicted alpha-1,2-mannosidase